MSKATQKLTKRSESKGVLQVRPTGGFWKYRYAIGVLCGCAVWCFAPASGSRSGRVVASDDVPGWLRQAAAVNVPAYDKKVPAVVLLDESRVTVDDEGRVTTVRNYAVKVLSR